MSSSSEHKIKPHDDARSTKIIPALQAVALTPGSSPRQALALSKRARDHFKFKSEQLEPVERLKRFERRSSSTA
jgi:hypothetical protein